MSNLGTVYYVDLGNGVKRNYPVVYLNNSYYYCKVYGCDTLEHFRRDNSPYLYRPHTFNLDEYLEKIKHDSKWRGYVYVPPHQNYNFPELKEGSLYHRLAQVEKSIKDLLNGIENRKTKIAELHKQNATVYEKLKTLSTEREKLLKAIIKENNNEH